MQQSELQALGQHIQAKLQQLPSPIRLRIRCAFREEALLVLAEHLLHVEPAPQQTFTAVADALQEYTPELMKSGLVRSGIGGTKFLPVRIYLRVAGYQQPYDSFVFSLKPLAPPTSANPPIPAFVPPPVVVVPSEPALQEQVKPEIVETEPVLEVEPVAEVLLVEEIAPIIEVEPTAEVEFPEEQSEFSDDPIATLEPVTEPAVEPEIAEPEIVEVSPIAEVEPIAEVPLVEEIAPIVEVEPVAEVELTEEQSELSDDPIATLEPVIEPATEPAVEPEIVEAEPVLEVEPVAEVELVEEQTELSDSPIATLEPVTEPAVEPKIVEAEPVSEVELVAEVPFVEEIAPIVEVEPVAEVEPVVEVELTEEPTQLSDDPIATIEAATEPAPVIEATSDRQTDWLPDITSVEVVPVEIAELEPVISEAAINEPVFIESIDAGQLRALEDPTSEEIGELPIAQETIAEPPAIAFEDPLVEPEAIADFLPLEEISSAPEEITPPQEVTTVVPAAIAPLADDVPLTADSPLAADETSFTQNEIQDEPESATDLQEEAIVEEPSESVTFFHPIPPLHISPLDTQPTQQDFLPEYLALTNAELTDSASLAEPEETETVDEPEIVEVLNLLEHDTILSESALVPELRENLEPENLASAPIPSSEEIVAAESAIAESPPSDERHIHFNDPTTPISPASLAPEDSVTQPPSQPVRVPQLSSSGIMMGTAIALFGLLGGWYIFSRPCVLGSRCEPLQQAQQISQAAFQTVQSTDSAIAIAKAYDDLDTANKLLKSIPSWSGQHQAAQALIADNESKSAVIGQLVRTLRKGNEAANRSQNPPHPLPEWREIQRLWRESIAALESIPSNAEIYPLAQRKATEYRANLDGINKRVVVEQQAQEEVENAKKTAQLAETRTGIANSPESWRDVYTSWQAAVNLLKNVPQGAAARLEAEELLKIYQSKLAAAGTRRDQENIAIAAYNKAIAQAEQAQSFQQKNQWQNAIANWEGALANVQKVSQGTTPYTQAQPLIATYQTALTQAQGGLRVSEAIQAAKPALDRSCGGTPKVCQYDAAPTAIRVQITYGYDQMVESAMTSAQAQGNSAAQAGVVSQVNTFLQELALISQTAQVPIDLYNANGSKFGTYSPEASGFIPR